MGDRTPYFAGGYFLFANGSASSRTQQMKSCATGLSVRFLSVAMATGRGEGGSLTGSGLKKDGSGPNRKADSGTSVTKRPPAKSFLRRLSELLMIVARGRL